MQRQLFYTSPVDHDRLDEWSALARTLGNTVRKECGDVDVMVGDEPVFGYGTDTEEAIAELGERHLAPRQVRVDLWCSIRHYAVLSFTLGPSVQRAERRNLVRRLKKTLAGQTLLREHEGLYELDSAQVYAYALSPHDAGDRVTIERLVEPLDEPIYIGEHWLLQDAQERVDTDSYEVIRRVGPNLAVFLVSDPEAAERVWAASTSGEGLFLFYPDEPAEEQMLRHFSSFKDLRILLAEEPGFGMRITIGRCRQDENLVVVYDPPFAPEIDEDVVFMV